MYEIYCKLRDEKGYKDSDVARITKITKSTFSDWKSGRSNPKNDKLQKIADCLGVTIDYLMTGKDEPEPEVSVPAQENSQDISNDLKNVLEKLRKGERGPAVYEGVKIPTSTAELFSEQINVMMKYLDSLIEEKKK